MKVEIKKGIAKGIVNAPPSKSMAHRMLICAGLSDGVSLVHGIAKSQDVLATIDCLEAIGVKCRKLGDAVEVSGVDIFDISVKKVLHCRESGSTLRFFIPIILATGEEARLTGSKTLLQRPLDVYKELCEENDLLFMQDEECVTARGPLKAGTYKMAGNISSQFISGMIFVLPLLDGESRIEIIPPVESKPYIDMTIEALGLFGVKVYWEDENTLVIPGNQKYDSKEVYVEGDYSNAAFLEALNVFGGQVEVENLPIESLQGDKAYKQMFDELQKENSSLNISDCPDLGPVLFAVAAAKNGGNFTGTSRLKIKESDRALAMAQELKKFGIKTELGENEVIIKPGCLVAPEEPLYGHNDHRIVMALAILLTLTGGVMEGAEAVTKSFPDFFDKLVTLGIEIKLMEE